MAGLLKESRAEGTLVNVSQIAKFKDDIKEAVALIVDTIASEFPKLDAVNDRVYNGIINGVAKQTQIALISYLSANPPGSKAAYEGKKASKGLLEAFLPNLPYAPMVLKSIAPKDLHRAIRGAFNEAARSDQELKARALSDKVRDLMEEISVEFGDSGESDHRSQEAYEYLFKVAERLDAIYEFRE
mgnify:FL=1